MPLQPRIHQMRPSRAPVALFRLVGPADAGSMHGPSPERRAGCPRVVAVPVPGGAPGFHAGGRLRRANEGRGRSHVAVPARHGADEIATAVDGPIQTRPSAPDVQAGPVNVPVAATVAALAATALAEFIGQQRGELRLPLSDGFVTEHRATHEEHPGQIAQGQAAVRASHHEGDDGRGAGCGSEARCRTRCTAPRTRGGETGDGPGPCVPAAPLQRRSRRPHGPSPLPTPPVPKPVRDAPSGQTDRLARALADPAASASPGPGSSRLPASRSALPCCGPAPGFAGRSGASRSPWPRRTRTGAGSPRPMPGLRPPGQPDVPDTASRHASHQRRTRCGEDRRVPDSRNLRAGSHRIVTRCRAAAPASGPDALVGRSGFSIAPSAAAGQA